MGAGASWTSGGCVGAASVASREPGGSRSAPSPFLVGRLIWSRSDTGFAFLLCARELQAIHGHLWEPRPPPRPMMLFIFEPSDATGHASNRGGEWCFGLG